MILGKSSEIILGVTNLYVSSDFYEKLGFIKLKEDNSNFSWILLYDGIILLLLKKSNFPYIKLDYFCEDMDNKINFIKTLQINILSKLNPNNVLYEATFNDNNNFKIGLIDSSIISPIKSFGKSFCKCGDFSEITISTQNLSSSLNFWSNLGFKPISTIKNNKSNSYAIITDNIIRIGFYQQNLIVAPSLTYSSHNMSERIKLLKDCGIKFTNEIKNIDGSISNAIIESPDGLNLLLFDKSFYK